MTKYKKLLKNLLKFFLSIIIYLIIITLLSSFNLINYKTVSVISLIFMALLFIISGIKTGKLSNKRGYLTGLITGIILVLLLLITSLIFKSFPNKSSWLYYLVLILCSTFGGMIGINKK